MFYLLYSECWTTFVQDEDDDDNEDDNNHDHNDRYEQPWSFIITGTVRLSDRCRLGSDSRGCWEKKTKNVRCGSRGLVSWTCNPELALRQRFNLTPGVYSAATRLVKGFTVLYLVFSDGLRYVGRPTPKMIKRWSRKICPTNNRGMQIERENKNKT